MDHLLHVSEMTGGKASYPLEPGAEQQRDQLLFTGHSGQSKHKHLQATSCQGHHALCPAAIYFIINYCLANKGRVQVKNTRNFQTEDGSRTRVGSQPLTADYKYPPGCGPSRITILSPL